jgi:hypothetical protein
VPVSAIAHDRLAVCSRSQPYEEFIVNHNRIATLVDELRKVYPDDHRVVKFLARALDRSRSHWQAWRVVYRDRRSHQDEETIL